MVHHSTRARTVEHATYVPFENPANCLVLMIFHGSIGCAAIHNVADGVQPLRLRHNRAD